MLATYALLPVIRRFTDPAGIAVEKIDISLAARILCQFPERLTPAQRAAGFARDTLAELGEIVKTPTANVIKLPNISASVPQLVRGAARSVPLSRSPPTLPLTLPHPLSSGGRHRRAAGQGL